MKKILIILFLTIFIVPCVAETIHWLPLDNSSIDFYDKNFTEITNGIYSITLKRTNGDNDLLYVGELDCQNVQIRYKAAILTDNIKNVTLDIIPMDYTWGSIMPGIAQKAYFKICK